MYRITSRMSSMALTLSGKAKRAGKGACLPRLTTREPTALPLVHGDTAALERDGGAGTNSVHVGESSPTRRPQSRRGMRIPTAGSYTGAGSS
jgi:hypothetical protein